MSARLSPIVSEFETEEQAARYDAWYREKVEAALQDTRPNIAHDAVMAEVRAMLEEQREKRRAR